MTPLGKARVAAMGTSSFSMFLGWLTAFGATTAKARLIGIVFILAGAFMFYVIANDGNG